jgi:hypothetical protein
MLRVGSAARQGRPAISSMEDEGTVASDGLGWDGRSFGTWESVKPMAEAKGRTMWSPRSTDLVFPVRNDRGPTRDVPDRWCTPLASMICQTERDAVIDGVGRRGPCGRCRGGQSQETAPAPLLPVPGLSAPGLPARSTWPHAYLPSSHGNGGEWTGCLQQPCAGKGKGE